MATLDDSCATPTGQQAQQQQHGQQLQAKEQQACRVCWGDGDEDEGGSLIAPCSCTGSHMWVHERCLREWQQTLHDQYLSHRARVCEVCKTPYRRPEYLDPLSPSERRRRQLAAIVRRLRSQATDVRSWVKLALKLWRAYVFVSGLYQAGRMGYRGLRVGVQLGQTLVKEQSTIMVQLLSRLAKVIGSPCAELLWTQAAAALALGLAGEFIYTSAIGLVTGAVYGFATGYTGAVNTSALLLKRGCTRIVALLLGTIGGMALGLTSRLSKLPAALPGLRRILCRGRA